MVHIQTVYRAKSGKQSLRGKLELVVRNSSHAMVKFSSHSLHVRVLCVPGGFDGSLESIACTCTNLIGWTSPSIPRAAALHH